MVMKRSNRISRRKRSSEQRSGVPFELAVAAIQRALDPNAIVTHDEKLIDRLGNRRQFDVVIRGKIGGHDVLGVIECKDEKNKVGTPTVDAFITKSRNVQANLAFIASRIGFTAPALKLATDHGIRCISLVSPGKGQPGVAVADYWYAHVTEWNSISIKLYFADNKPTTIEDVHTIKFQEKSVYDWVLYEFEREFGDIHGRGDFGLQVQFATPQLLTVNGVDRPIAAIQAEATKKLSLKRKLVFWLGNCLYEFNTRKLLIPANTGIQSDPIRSDFSDWEEINSIPTTGLGFLNMQFHARLVLTVPNQPAFNFRSLGEIEFVDGRAQISVE